MVGFPSPFSRGDSSSEELFADYEAFETEYIPEPGPFLSGYDVLTGEDHTGFHQISKEVFEKRGVYDMTFGYNLARLNVDTRHPNAGYRYAEQDGESSVLRAEFTPTTQFCPQSDTLTTGSFRAWNGLSDSHEYDIVRVRVADMHQRSDEINRTLKELAQHYRDTGSVTLEDDGVGGGQQGCGDGSSDTSRGYGADAPF